MRSVAAILCVIVLVRKGNAEEFGLTVEVKPGKFECFFQPITDPKYKTMEIDYQVIDGGDLNINFMLIFGAEVSAQEALKQDGHHKIDIKQLGDYQICFDNTFSYQARKVVYFEVYIYDAEGRLEDFDISKFAKNDPAFQQRMQTLGIAVTDFHASADRVKAHLNKAEYYLALLRAYEARDRSIMDANLNRVNFWSVLNALVLVVVGVVQVYMIRSLFEENSKIGRALRR
jgi:protein ERP2